MERAKSFAAASPPCGMGSLSPGTTGTPASVALRRARVFSPISSIASGGGPMNVMPALAQARELRVLGEEPVARVHRVRAGGLAGRDHVVDDQVALARRRRTHPHGFVAGPH